MADVQEKVVLITGASSGIGEAAARELGRRGARLMLGARRTDRLESVVADIRAAGGTAEFRALDVTQLNQMEAFVQAALDRYGRVDVFVNNAGVMPLSMLEQRKVEEWDRMLDVNVRGVLYGIAAALPVMQAQKSGQFVNISSIGGRRVSPSAAVYCATKYAVGAISDGLRQETDYIRVSVISPGVTESELAESISDPAARDAMKDFRQIAIPADAITRAICFAIEQPDGVDVSEMIVRPTASPY